MMICRFFLSTGKIQICLTAECLKTSGLPNTQVQSTLSPHVPISPLGKQKKLYFEKQNQELKTVLKQLSVTPTDLCTAALKISISASLDFLLFHFSLLQYKRFG